jgi:hypothetical protein
MSNKTKKKLKAEAINEVRSDIDEQDYVDSEEEKKGAETFQVDIN